MSNHMIGHAMSPVLTKIMEMRLNDEISDKSTEILIKEIIQAVCDWDGNEYEATEEIDRLFCGHCGKRVPVSQPIFDAYLTVFDSRHGVNDDHYKKYSHYCHCFCEDCFREFLSTHPNKYDVDKEIARQHKEKWVHFSEDMDS